MYKAVIFDFFGVFCTPIATNWFQKNVSDYDAKRAAFRELLNQSDLGRLSRAGFDTEVSRLTGVPVDEITHGIEAEISINSPLVTHAQGLKAKGYRIACLSNGSHEWTLQIINSHGLGDLFEQVILSSDLGMVKPNPEIYACTLRALHLPAAQTIFVDDKKANTDAAEACGIRSLVFSDTPTFIKEFEILTQAVRA